MSKDFCEELKDFLSNEWIKIADACAIFAGWVPIEEYVPDYTCASDYGPRMYLRLADGKRITPGEAGFKEIIRIQKKWTGSDWQFTRRNTGMLDRDPMNDEIRVRDAFRIGLAMNIPRVAILFYAAVEQNLIADVTSAPPVQNYTIQVSGFEAKGEVGDIPKPKHKFEIGKANAAMPKVIVEWLKVIRSQGETWPENQADKFLTWLGDSKPKTPFVEIEEITGSHIKFWNLNAGGGKKDKVVQTYDKNNINGRIKVLCKKD